MTNLRAAIVALGCTPLLFACTAEQESSVGSERRGGSNTGEIVATVALASPQWRHDPDCFEAGARIESEPPGYLDVEKVKWRRPRIFRGYLFIHLEGNSFVAASRIERPDIVVHGRYQAELYSAEPEFPSSSELQAYWLSSSAKKRFVTHKDQTTPSLILYSLRTLCE